MAQVENVIEKDSLTTLFQANALLENLDASPDLDHTTDKIAIENLKRHHLTTKDMALESGLMETNATTQSQKDFSDHDKKRKDRHYITEVLIQMEEARQNLENMRNLIDMRLEEVNTKLVIAHEERDTLQEEADVVQDALDNFETSGEFELNEDGSFKNDVLESAIREYEEKHGKIDRDNTALLNHILTLKLAEYNEQITSKDRDIEQLERDRQYYTDLDEQLDDAEAKLNSDDPNVRQEGLDEIEALDDEVKLGLTVGKQIDAQSEAETEALNEELTAQVVVTTAPKF
tara:strand:+ start:80 stop:946 length:867 start_codon:yes stop_codon:yes gene_type:complete